MGLSYRKTHWTRWGAKPSTFPTKGHLATDKHHGKGIDTETLEVGAGSLRFCGFRCFWSFSVSGLASYPPGPILELCFCGVLLSTEASL